MTIQPQVSLADYSTMGLGGNAAFLVEVHDRMELLEALTWAQTRQLPFIMIGSGSNLVWRDEGFPGLVIIDRLQRFEIFEEDETNVYVTIGGGEIWDSVVERCVQAGLSGIEALSLIPGTAGATPIQNVGAYGQEIAQTLVTVEAFDIQAKDFVNVRGSDCGFSYRTSRFKTVDRGRFFITAITLHLLKGAAMQPPFYPAVATYLEQHPVQAITPQIIREAVIAIRTAKLPDPRLVKNCGSFFANPVITPSQIVQIEANTNTSLPHWAAEGNKEKIPAAWLIEQIGFKDYHDLSTGMATWNKQPLVIINEHAKSTADLLRFRDKIVTAVADKFNIQLEQEPELLP